MEVPENSADRWSRVLDSYELYFAVNSPWLMWMIDLIRDVMASPLAQELYPHTSHYSLCFLSARKSPSDEYTVRGARCGPER
jgi:hypothetical protein